jgi:hypothetical protein
MGIHSITRGPAGPQGEQGEQGPAGEGGGGPDWADADSVTLAADWTDAGALGSATTTHKADRALGVRVFTNLQSDGVNSASGNRTQGVVQSVAAGDFIVGIRFRILRPLNLIGDASTVLQVGPVFVDGADLATADWYALSQYYSGSTALNAALLYLIGDGVGFDTYSSFGTILNGGSGSARLISIASWSEPAPRLTCTSARPAARCTRRVRSA